MKKNSIFVSLILSIVCMLTACKNAEQSIAVVWTSKPELSRYCELFNASQNKYKIMTHYVANPSHDLLNEAHVKAERPDVVIDCWLKGTAVRNNFMSLNSLLSDSDEKKINPNIFYTELLELGKNGSDQVFLPVSFNLPVIIFRKAEIKPADEFNISLEEIQSFSQRYNVYENKKYMKMGFAPIWNPEFLYLVAKGNNACFEEHGDFFSWSENSVKLAVTAIRKFTLETNTDSNAESDFQFKYLYNNAYSAIMSGRCLFQYLRSDELLMLDRDKMSHIDFRWMNFEKKTPLDDEMIYAGILKSARNKTAAKAFLRFLFSAETQTEILAEKAETKLSSLGFGIVGGFSSLRSITENIFPKYYPLLLSHLPQSKGFMSPHILPSNWLEIKQNILIPYLQNACEIEAGAADDTFGTLGNYINRIKLK